MVRGKLNGPLILFALFYFTLACAVNYQPWVGNCYEFQFQSDLNYQGFSNVATGSKFRKYSSSDIFWNFQLSNSDDCHGLEVACVLARTRKQMWDVDNVSFTGKLVWLDELIGDPLTLTTGLKLSECFEPALHDLSSFHHGRGEAELFLSFGKETEQNGSLWLARGWGVVGMGIADRGWAWLRGQLAYEFRVCTYHELGFQINTLWGLGHKRLHTHDFHGYGPIQHRSVDVGLKYNYTIEFVGYIGLEYYYRPYAKNFPAQTHHVVLSLLVPFGW